MHFTISAHVRHVGALCAAACALAWAPPAVASATGQGSSLSTQFCAAGKPQTAAQQDRVLRFAATIRDTLQAGDDEVALIARSGLDLSRFGLRYSHAGVLLRGADGAEVPWSVRQLYYDCEHSRPRLFDQGLAGFLMSAEAPDRGFVSVVLLPRAQADRLRAVALDPARVSRLLASDYSANAYPFSTRYQNCNQWVAELLATAWAPLADGPQLRERAQTWLQQTGYAPTDVAIDSHLTKFVAGFMPLLHLDDHPSELQLGMRFQVSLPEAIEAYARDLAPTARRIEFCHDATRIVVREGWQAMASCKPAPGDRVIAL
ncbi:hypothetical protein CCO03_01210 [Comamonas serinivorans]|uniref:DUF2145 domain-containing protein n=1 Tax=Comamonas serinivorans TaxID=1082851 RepID=A0A1Y0ESH4_9BURK|nr:DUF2145 domain-containing protein [Comamonas serinivorans]ARU06563.1 hypothetical protein CCO03_01210 [Comamonas serinivorans]